MLLELFSLIAFTAEYVLRFWVAAEHGAYHAAQRQPGPR